MNIADAIRVAIQHLTSSTGRTPHCFDRLGDLRYAEGPTSFISLLSLIETFWRWFNIPCYNCLVKRHTILRHHSI